MSQLVLQVKGCLDSVAGDEQYRPFRSSLQFAARSIRLKEICRRRLISNQDLLRCFISSRENLLVVS